MAADIGLIGLAVMGQSLVLNLANKGYRVAVFTRSKEVTEEFAATRAKGKSIDPYYALGDFVKGLSRPRKIILLVKAGEAVDQVIESLIPLVEKGDIIIDSGNSFFRDSERRLASLEARGINFIGMGISGGEKGALLGPSIMPGGDRDVVNQVMPILRKVAAQEPEPCVAYMGKKGAGHFVKMVHNGIEYADMQLIAEIYDIARQVFHYSNDQLHELFQNLGKTELNSYLVEITEKIFTKKEEGKYLVDLILDVAGSKGTGMWTVQEGFALGCPVPSIAAAQAARNLSAFEKERHDFSKNKERAPAIDLPQDVFTTLKGAMLAGKILAYAQGMHMLYFASKDYGFELNLAEIARIWRGGCIIRSVMLNDIAAAYHDQSITHLLQSPKFSKLLKENLSSLRQAVSLAALRGIPAPSLSSALWYWDTLAAEELPANLTQAQRDFFGAHTFKRIDKSGTFHVEWE